MAFDRQSYAKGAQRANEEADQRALFTIAEYMAQLVKGRNVRLVNITTSIAVNPERVSEVTADYQKQKLYVKMQDGGVHTVEPSWGGSMAEAYTKLVNDLQGLV